MTMQSDRSFQTDRIQRDRVTPDAQRKIASWTKWEANATEPFEIHYDRAVSFCVMEGRAKIAFTDGTSLDVQKDDFVTIKPDIKGVWTVIEPITNLYVYHDTGAPA
ncbi:MULTISPECIES: cupin domain-containing protein [unclassified Rhizobium]|uniref:cupin domain-containing protein n=1 Tax=unclassified Rhizobium TaxID=2613769 RepID=UPI00149582CD|nr:MULTISPECIES: cupin domain-containing protein [unclassified Rhizobium]